MLLFKIIMQSYFVLLKDHILLLQHCERITDGTLKLFIVHFLSPEKKDDKFYLKKKKKSQQLRVFCFFCFPLEYRRCQSLSNCLPCPLLWATGEFFFYSLQRVHAGMVFFAIICDFLSNNPLQAFLLNKSRARSRGQRKVL